MAEIIGFADRVHRTVAPDLSHLSQGAQDACKAAGYSRDAIVGARPGRGVVLFLRGDGAEIAVPADYLVEPVAIAVMAGEQS